MMSLVLKCCVLNADGCLGTSDREHGKGSGLRWRTVNANLTGEALRVHNLIAMINSHMWPDQISTKINLKRYIFVHIKSYS